MTEAALKKIGGWFVGLGNTIQLNMPGLTVGRIYHEPEVKHLFVDHGGRSTDWGRVNVRFPWPLDDALGHDHENFRRDDEMVVQYVEFPIAELLEQIHELQSGFARGLNERQKIEVIKEKYVKGEPIFPIFVQSNDPQKRICEGMHRAVVLLECRSTVIPAFRSGYGDWFA